MLSILKIFAKTVVGLIAFLGGLASVYAIRNDVVSAVRDGKLSDFLYGISSSIFQPSYIALAVPPIFSLF